MNTTQILHQQGFDVHMTAFHSAKMLWGIGLTEEGGTIPKCFQQFRKFLRRISDVP
jgi:hypothetical protein